MRLPQARRGRILREIPPRRCAGRSSRSGEQCRQWALVGATVCVAHGARAPQVRAAADRRVGLAEAIAAAPRRSPQEILVDATHAADVLLGQAVAAAGEPMSVDQLDQVVSSIGRAAQLAKVALDAGLDEATLAAQTTDKIIFVLQVAGGAVGLDMSESKVRAAVGAALRDMDKLGLPGPDRRARLKTQIAVVNAAVYAKAGAQRREVVDDLRREARSMRCPVCNAPPGGGQVPAIAAAEPAVSPAEASAPVVGGPPGSDGFAAVGPVQPAGGAIVEDRGPVRAVAEVGRAIGRFPSCAGCGRPRDPGHEATCGYVAAADRGWVR